MARLTKIMVGVAALCASTLACADPVSLIAFTASALGASQLVVVGISLVGGLIMSNQAKKKQAAAAAAQRSQYNAGLQDRNVSVLSTESPWQVVYGNPAPVGGSIVAILTSGERERYKHLVVVFASHECEAIDEIYLDGEAVGTLDVNGSVTSGVFVRDAPPRTGFLFSLPPASAGFAAGEVFTEQITFNTSGIGAAAFAGTALVSAIAYTLDLNGDSVEQPFTGATISGTTINLNVTLAAPLVVTVTYSTTNPLAAVNVKKHLSPSGVDTADSFLGSRAGAGVWTSADKLSGFTYAVITLDLDLPRFQGGPPNISARLRGKKIYDPRTATTIYSANPALCLADFIMSEAGYGASLAQFDATQLIAAANACDAAGFRADGAFKTEQDRETTKQQLEDCFGGTCHQSGGVWRITAGSWTTPVMTLTDADCGAPIQISQASYTSKERYNTVRGKYVDGAGLGVANDFTPWQNSAYVVSDGLVKVRDISLPFTKDHQRAQDLARMIVERSRGGLTITYPGQMRLWPLQPGDRVSITNAEFGWSAKTFRMTDWGFHPHSPVTCVFVEDVAVYYDAAAVITADAAPNTNLPNPLECPALAGLTAESGTDRLLRQSDKTIITRVYWQWNLATSNYVTTGGKVQRQWRLASATDSDWADVDQQPGDSINAYQTGLPDGATVILRARFINQLGIPGTWATIAHTVVGKTAPPAAPASVSVTQNLVFWTPVADVDLAGYLIRSQPGSSGVFSRGTPLHTGVVTDSPWVLNVRLYGVQTIMVAAVDTTGNISPATSATLDFGQPDSGNVVAVVDYRAAGFGGTFADCSVVSGDLVADIFSSADVYALADAYGEPDLYATQYKAMTWESPVFLPTIGGGTVFTTSTLVGASQNIEYRIDGDTITNIYSSADVYASADLYGAPGAYQPWPGSIVANRMQGIQWRITAASSAEQGKVTAFTASLAAQEVAQTFPNQAISSAGTRLTPSAGTPARTWVNLRSVQVTPIVDGSNAIAGRVLDFSPALGALTQLVDNTGTAVSGTSTIEIRGLADV